MPGVTHLTNQSQFIQSNATFFGTNITGTIASNAISLSVAPGGGGADGYNLIAAGSQTANSTGTVVFSNLNGVSFGMSNNSVVTASHNGLTQQSTQPVAYSAANGSANFSTLSFANSNGVSFSTGTQGVFATVKTDYLTTAMQSNKGSDFMGTNTALTANGVSMTANSSGLSLNFPAFLTTAQPVGAYLTTARASNDAIGLNTAQTNVTWTVNSSGLSINAGGYAGTGFATTTTNGSVVVGTNASNGMTLAVPPYLTTAQAPGAYLTTAAQSNQVVNSLNGSTGQISLNVGSSLSASTNGSSITFGLASNITTALQSAGAYLTTAALSNHSHNFATTTTNGASIIVATTNSNGATIGVPAFLTTAQPVGAYLTTARASNDAIGLNTAGSNVTWTVNSSGLSFDGRGYAGTNTAMTGGSVTLNSSGVSINLPAYLTTAMASNAGSNFVGLNSAVTGASLTVNSSGISINVPAAAPSPVYVQAGTTNGSLGTISFANSNGVSFGLSGSTITASAAGGGAGVAISASNSAFTSGTVSFNQSGALTIGTGAQAINFSVPQTSSLSGTGQVSISVNGSTISIGVPNPLTVNYFNPQDGYVQVVGQQGNASMHIQPMQAPNVQFDRIAVPLNFTNATNTTGSATMSMSVGFFTNNASTLSLLSSVSYSVAVTYSGTVNNSTYAGVRLHTIPFTGTFNESQYYVGIWSRTTTGGANGTLNQVLASQMNSSYSGLFGVGTNATMQYTRGLGHYSATFTTAMPSSVNFSEIRGISSIVLRQPIFYLVNGTV